MLASALKSAKRTVPFTPLGEVTPSLPLHAASANDAAENASLERNARRSILIPSKASTRKVDSVTVVTRAHDPAHEATGNGVVGN